MPPSRGVAVPIFIRGMIVSRRFVVGVLAVVATIVCGFTWFRTASSASAALVGGNTAGGCEAASVSVPGVVNVVEVGAVVRRSVWGIRGTLCSTIPVDSRWPAAVVAPGLSATVSGVMLVAAPSVDGSARLIPS